MNGLKWILSVCVNCHGHKQMQDWMTKHRAPRSTEHHGTQQSTVCMDTGHTGPGAWVPWCNNRQSLRKCLASSPLELSHGSTSSALNNPDSPHVCCFGPFVTGEGNWTSPSAGTWTAKCKDRSQSSETGCLPAQRQGQDSHVSPLGLSSEASKLCT